MKTAYNEIFKQLLTEYNLQEDFLFLVDIPTEVQEILDDQILLTELGVTLKSFDGLHKATQEWENQSIIEDNENHFHVDWYVEPVDNKKAFMLGVKTLKMLADKFKRENIQGIRFWYSFQTPELGKVWAKQNNVDEDDDEHFICDRLSFFKRRDNEELISAEQFKDRHWAILIIDI